MQLVWDFPLCTFKESQVEFSLNYDVFLSLEVVLTLAIRADPDEMQHCAASHQGLHCLPKYPLRGFPVYKGLYQAS